MGKIYKVILSGGGTGGHIYPAVAVAQALTQEFDGKIDILFVGALGRMEMEKVPALGYKIVGLPVAGLQRKLSLSNFILPFKVVRSLMRAKSVIRNFGADIVVGFGGYASAPVLWSAQRMGVPTVVQEQNSYAGMTNKILAKRANVICVAYDGMERFFPANKIVMTGNPLRGNFGGLDAKRGEALKYFGLDAAKPVILVVGGSLGTRTLNEMVKRWVDSIVSGEEVQVVWQTGKYYEAEMELFMSARADKGIWRGAFIERMDYAYAAADIVISRSGAGTVSELCLVGKPVIFVPSPNVAEDHQTMNAMALVNKDAAAIVVDNQAVERAIPLAIELLKDVGKLSVLSTNILALGVKDSAQRVAHKIMEILDNNSYK